MVQVNDGAGSNYAYYTVRHGECLTALPESGNNAGWYYADTDEPFDMTQPITEDTAIYGKQASSRLYTMVRIAPPVVLAVMFAALCFADGMRTKRNGKNDRSKCTEISS